MCAVGMTHGRIDGDCSTSVKMVQFDVEKYDGWMDGRIGITLCAVN